jgi:hypothetical protein
MSPCMRGGNLFPCPLSGLQCVLMEDDAPCRMREEHDVGAGEKEMLSLIATVRPASGPDSEH